VLLRAKSERFSKEIPESIAVIDDTFLNNYLVSNIANAISQIPGVLAVSKNGGYDPRLIIRGAGLKAPYGVREIMVVRDGVPMTDPDSFTRFDYIDMQDLERIEVTKGPGSLLAANSAGGVIQLISKSPLDNQNQRVKFSMDNYDQYGAHMRGVYNIDEESAVSLTYSAKSSQNSWREHNRYDSNQLSFKYAKNLEGGTVRSELSYSIVNMELPTSMTQSEFESFKKSGKQENTSAIWQNSARDSKILFFNTQYETKIGALDFKPRIYANGWDHYHPVTGFINDSQDNRVFGTDLEFGYAHTLAGESNLVFGLTARQDMSNDAKKYTYSNINSLLIAANPQRGILNDKTQVIRTLGEEKGDLASKEDTKNTLLGFYFLESMEVIKDVKVDVGLRYDQLRFDIKGHEYIGFDYSSGAYDVGSADGAYTFDTKYNLFSPKVGVSYALSEETNSYINIAQGNQAPSDSEVKSNILSKASELKLATIQNYEVGLKHRSRDTSIDMAIYQMMISDDIVQVPQTQYTTIYQNAGKTEKKGLEVSGTYDLFSWLNVGVNYAYSDYKYSDFKEIVRVRGAVTTQERSGNQLPFIPKHQYSLSSNINYENIVMALSTQTWGEYHIDAANSEKFGGFEFVTNMMLGYFWGDQSLQLNVNNLFDQRYAVSVTKSSSGNSYSAGAPLMATLSYMLEF
jgi:iron complex outermembrane recepter protein